MVHLYEEIGVKHGPDLVAVENPKYRGILMASEASSFRIPAGATQTCRSLCRNSTPAKFFERRNAIGRASSTKTRGY